MILSVQQIKFEIYAYIKEFGADFSEWCIGAAADPRAAMRDHHGVHETDDIWLFKRAVSFRACQTIHGHFTQKLQVAGAPLPPGDGAADCIYLYKKSSRTRP